MARTDDPILNDPHEEPTLHYATDTAGNLDYPSRLQERRSFTPDTPIILIAQNPQGELSDINELDEDNLGEHALGAVWFDGLGELFPSYRLLAVYNPFDTLDYLGGSVS